MTAALERHHHQPVWRAAAALRELAAGNAPSARVHYDVLRAGGFRVLRGPTGSLPALCLTAELAAGLRDGDGARDLTELLAPLAGRHAVLGPPATAYLGVVDHYLGLLAAARGDHPAALTHLTRAVEHHGTVGAAPWVCRSQVELARAHLAADDDEAAHRLLVDAHRLATDLAMAPLVARVADLAEAGRAASPPRPVPGAAVFRREGEVWTVSLGAESTRVVDVKGMHYLHRRSCGPRSPTPRSWGTWTGPRVPRRRSTRSPRSWPERSASGDATGPPARRPSGHGSTSPGPSGPRSRGSPRGRRRSGTI